MPKNHKNVRVDLYVLEAESSIDAFDIESVFKTIIKTQKKKRVKRVGGDNGYPYCLYNIYENDKYIWGLFGRIRNDLLDPKGNLSGDLEPLDWARDEGQVQLNHFVFDKKTNVLSFPYQQAGIRIGRFTEYLNFFAGHNSILTYRPVLRREAFRKLLSQAKETKELDLRYKIPSNRKELERSGLADDEIIRLAGKYGAMRVEIIMRPEKPSRAESSLSNIKGFVEKYIGHEDIVSGQLKVKYGDGNENPDVIKLTDMSVYSEKKF